MRTFAVNLHTFTKLTGLAIDLDAVVQELLKLGTIEDTLL